MKEVFPLFLAKIEEPKIEEDFAAIPNRKTAAEWTLSKEATAAVSILL